MSNSKNPHRFDPSPPPSEATVRGWRTRAEAGLWFKMTKAEVEIDRLTTLVGSLELQLERAKVEISEFEHAVGLLGVESDTAEGAARTIMAQLAELEARNKDLAEDCNVLSDHARALEALRDGEIKLIEHPGPMDGDFCYYLDCREERPQGAFLTRESAVEAAREECLELYTIGSFEHPGDGSPVTIGRLKHAEIKVESSAIELMVDGVEQDYKNDEWCWVESNSIFELREDSTKDAVAKAVSSVLAHHYESRFWMMDEELETVEMTFTDEELGGD